MRKLLALIALASGALTTGAMAETITVDNFFTMPGGATTINGPITVDEAATDFGGTYTLNNNSNLKIWGFGVSNASFGTFTQNNNLDGCCGTSAILNAANWDTYVIDFYNGLNGLTGQDIFGDIANVLGAGDTHFHWYDDVEVGYETGTFSGFDFFNGQLASEVIVVGQSGIYGTSVSSAPSPVPLPAAGWMLIAGLGGLVAMRRRTS